MRNLPAVVFASMLPAILVAAAAPDQSAVPGQVTPARPTPGGAAAATGTAVIRGTVVAMDTGTPLRRVQIRAMSVSPGVRDARVTTTDDQGRFELRELAAGRYSIVANKAGFVGLQFGQRRPNERGTPVEVGDGQTVEKVAIALPRGGVITGRVADDAGEPVAGLRVQVMRYMYGPGGRRLLPASQGDSTDDQGNYRIYGLPPGDYYVSAASGPSMMMPDARLAAGDSDQGFAPTYYPGTPSPADAQKVTVAVGQEVGGISFGLTPTRLSRISGRVIGWPNTAGGGFVMVTPEDGGMMMGMVTPPGQIQPEGDFEIRSVPPGRYVLRVMPGGPRDADALVGLTTVTVAGTDLANVTIAMQPQGVLRGRIDFEGGAPAAAVRASQIHLVIMPADQRSMQLVMSGPPEVAEDFTFTARGVMGPVLVRPNGPPGWHLKSVVLDGEDVTDTPVTLGPGAAIDGVRVLLTQAVSTVSGSVRDDRGNLVLDATVLVFPDDDARWQFASRHIRTVRPDTQGRFEFAALPPSNGYRIVALPSLEDGQAFDPEFLASMRDRAERLALAEGETKAVDLRLRP